MSVTRAAQAVQHSAAPDAYAQWEAEARALASAFTGEQAGTFTCHDLALAAPATMVVALATAELGDTQLSGPHDAAHGWALASWLVGHAVRLGVDQVSFDGRTWTASSGSWATTGAANGQLALHQISGAT
jgi:hypothetical protein